VGGAQNEPNHGLGQRPALDLARAQELCALEEDQLSLMPLARLESLLEDLARNTADASTLLSWLLQLKDAQSQDQAT
jgi:hypothetical protein